MKFDNQLRYAVRVIDSYRGETPLHNWLKDFFRAHKQMGSRDRRLAADLVYGFYRLGHALRETPVEERLLIAMFLCHDEPQEMLGYLKPDWNTRIALPVDEKTGFLKSAGFDLRITDIFPWKDELSPGIDHESFCRSFLRQPDLWLRIRPGFEQTVLKKLGERMPPAGPKTGALPKDGYALIAPHTLRLPNGLPVDEWLEPDKEAVVQDYSSQRIAEFMELPATGPGPEPASGVGKRNAPSIWDACAASGGKSILAHDLFPRAEITVSDIRDSILHNLRSRFRAAGITRYRAFVADLTREGSGGAGRYDLIIADLPCTGSGTWSRTPEELYFFQKERIAEYGNRQQKILSNLPAHLVHGGNLLYCTCSVFKAENETLTEWAARQSGVRIVKQSVIKGYEDRADTMFASLINYD